MIGNHQHINYEVGGFRADCVFQKIFCRTVIAGFESFFEAAAEI